MAEVKTTTKDDEKRYTQRLPGEIWKLCRYHQIESSESMNALVVRLLTDFFKDKK